MKNFWTSSLVTASLLVLATAVQAQPGNDDQQAPPARGQRPAFLTEDGSIDLAKLTPNDRMTEEQIEKMKQADADGNGLLTREEMQNAQLGFGGRGPGMGPGMGQGMGPGGMGGGMLAMVFKDAMTDNGRLKIADVTKILKKFDKDKDGCLDEEEMNQLFAAARPRDGFGPGNGPGDGPGNNDRPRRGDNRQGPNARGPLAGVPKEAWTEEGAIDLSKLTESEELSAESIEKFQKADADGNGQLTRNEIQSIMSRVRNRFGTPPKPTENE